MARTIQDENFLTWEIFPSAGDHGFSAQPYIVFNCLTDRMQRPRQYQLTTDEAEAETMVDRASDQELLTLFKKAEYVE